MMLQQRAMIYQRTNKFSVIKAIAVDKKNITSALSLSALEKESSFLDMIVKVAIGNCS